MPIYVCQELFSLCLYSDHSREENCISFRLKLLFMEKWLHELIFVHQIITSLVDLIWLRASGIGSGDLGDSLYFILAYS